MARWRPCDGGSFTDAILENYQIYVERERRALRDIVSIKKKFQMLLNCPMSSGGPRCLDIVRRPSKTRRQLGTMLKPTRLKSRRLVAAGNFEADGDPGGSDSNENEAHASERKAVTSFECLTSPDSPVHVANTIFIKA
ncbi:hypothetical protein JG687_00018117 [Phytophthora cactorum]|uniref:Uncharacterized protein n=1 Tax=Phytophthora cactorum TaxID=29920 RepID=A0A8T1TQC6_9STRA|nr:hypothetical protein JG687_00018117 [Phytophthora cactorum]